MSKLVAVSIFSMWLHTHLNQVPKYFIHPQRKPVMITFYSYSGYPLQAPTLFSASIDLHFLEAHINEIMDYMTFYAWLLLLMYSVFKFQPQCRVE